MQNRILLVRGNPSRSHQAVSGHQSAQGGNVATVTVCATAQHRQMLDQVLKLANVVPDVDLNVMTAQPDPRPADRRACCSNVGEVLDRVRPGAGDRPGRHHHRHGQRAGCLLPAHPSVACRGRPAQRRHLRAVAGGGEPQDHRHHRRPAFRAHGPGRGRAAGGERAGRADPRHRKHGGRRPSHSEENRRFRPAPRLPLGQHPPRPPQPARHPRHLPSPRELRRRYSRHRRRAADHPPARGRRHRASPASQSQRRRRSVRAPVGPSACRR